MKFIMIGRDKKIILSFKLIIVTFYGTMVRKEVQVTYREIRH